MDVTYQPPAGQPPYPTHQTTQVPVMSVKDWLITLLISMIPIAGIVMFFVWAFGDNTNLNKKNYAKAVLIMSGIVIALYVVVVVLVLVIAGISDAGRSY
ncbi:hypothetical protein CBW46_000850 [Paenibacillus xerothermodurans]|uniref:Uncharacterized protein n=2 Tax=Paenibacillus xerothermodurans TaxID=1977292 RepID=A0A2W1NEB0_PAEXE|nr:hypothetical protein CBW46_000850 [Paenibacillus xerothermodurans]